MHTIRNDPFIKLLYRCNILTKDTIEYARFYFLETLDHVGLPTKEEKYLNTIGKMMYFPKMGAPFKEDMISRIEHLCQFNLECFCEVAYDAEYIMRLIFAMYPKEIILQFIKWYTFDEEYTKLIKEHTEQ